MAAARRPDRDPTRPVYVISVAATLVSAHPRTLRIYEDEGLVCPARTPTNIRLYSEEDIRRILWIRHLTRDRGVNLAGVRDAVRARGTSRQAHPRGAVRRRDSRAGRSGGGRSHDRPHCRWLRGNRPGKRIGAHVIAFHIHLTPRIRTVTPDLRPAPKETF